jgi:hypothetical protein
MISNCANPACATPLRYLRDGRLFQFEVKALAANRADTVPGQGKKTVSRQVWHYWLCGQCSASMTLEFDGREGLKVIPLPHSHQPHYSAASQLAS